MPSRHCVCALHCIALHCICSAAVIMDYGGDDDDDDDGWNGMDKRAASRKMLITQVKPRNH